MTVVDLDESVLSNLIGSRWYPKPNRALRAVDRTPRRLLCALAAGLRAKLTGRVAVIREAVAACIGFGMPSVAAFQWHTWAGYIAVGLAALLVERGVNWSGRTTTGPEGDEQ